MSFIFRRYKRAISPVVTTLFLFGVIIGAIAISLGIVFPQVNRMNDQIQLETSGSSMESLDTSIQNLVLSGPNSEIFTEIKVGQGGFLQYNNGTISDMGLYEEDPGGGLVDNWTITHDQLQIGQPVVTNWMEEGTHQYFGGAGDQSSLFLNSTTRKSLQWSIINQSREVGSDDVLTSLSYRVITLKNSFFNASTPGQFATFEVHLVNFTLSDTSDQRATGAKIGLGLKFLGSQTQTTDYYPLDNAARLEFLTSFPQSSTNIRTIPLRLEDPVSDDVEFNIRIQFIFHVIELTL